MTDPLAGLLFGSERKLLNLKLLRGDSPEVSEDELRDEAHAALLKVVLGTTRASKSFPEDATAKRVDLAQLGAI